MGDVETKNETLNNLINSSSQVVESNAVDLTKFLSPVIMAQINKYGFSKAVETFEKYIHKNEINCFTRDDNARLKMVSLKKETMVDYIQGFQGGTNAHSIIEMIRSSFHETLDTLKIAIDETEKKYGHGQAITAIKMLYENNELSYFTNNARCRSALEEIGVSSKTVKIVVTYLNNQNLELSNLSYFVNDYEMVYSALMRNEQVRY